MNPRLRRLQADYDHVREIYSGHPHVTITPLGDRFPPENYRITYRLRGLQLEGDQPAFRDEHSVEIMLPRKYPAERPYAVPLEPIFHPNIREYFCIADYWAAGTTLVDVIAKIGDMIQWRIYNPASPLDAIAARWAVEQEANNLFPIGNVDLGVADFDVAIRVAGSESAVADDALAGQTAPELSPLATTDGMSTTTNQAAPADREDFEVLIKGGSE